MGFFRQIGLLVFAKFVMYRNKYIKNHVQALAQKVNLGRGTGFIIKEDRKRERNEKNEGRFCLMCLGNVIWYYIWHLL